MKTELYKMWIDFCLQPKKRFNISNFTSSPEGITGCEISFSYGIKQHNGIAVEWMSPEYKAWNAWKNVKCSSKTIIEFVVKNWNDLKMHFPATCITLDMLNLDISCLLEKDVYYKSSVIKMIKHALSTDIKSRKR